VCIHVLLIMSHCLRVCSCFRRSSIGAVVIVRTYYLENAEPMAL
jgi:hypothetical protein